jgi:hypothetical protein
MTISADPVAETGVIQRVSFYFSAHHDDWQLFMNPSAFRDVRDGNTMCVFVHMTAGDAGLGTGDGGCKHLLYLARENGAESAIRFMADPDYVPPVEKVVSRMVFNGQPSHDAAHQRFLKEGRKPRAHDGDLFHALQFRAHSSNAENYACNGGKCYRQTLGNV